MKLRIARHTNNLESIILFYTIFLKLEVLGSFKDHNGYDGVFLGIPAENWHLEFTVSAELPDHHPDEDDLMIFYPDSIGDYELVLNRFSEGKLTEETAKNPYWNTNGVTFTDPDGYRIVISNDNI